MNDHSNRASMLLPASFRFGELRPNPKGAAPAASPSPLGPLSAFTGDWAGHGFNTIFRPNNNATPTQLPARLPVGDNVLELNLTAESLSFSKSLGSVPNRGSSSQGDIFLNGVPYVQSINDITIQGESVAIHFEPGLWMHVPATSVPAVNEETIVRMASIPHGTTIEAQGTFSTRKGPPQIDPVDITPFSIGNPNNKFRFPSQTATDGNTARIPQDLTSYIAAGTITQALLDDPNSLLRSHISHQTIVQTTTLTVSTSPKSPISGGGADNISFLMGGSNSAQENANAVQMNATFWIEEVEEKIVVPVFRAGHPPIPIKGDASALGQRVPTFLVHPPVDIKMPRTITVRFTQIQYTQTVLLNFAGLTWPHVSVNTLVPADHVVVPQSVWD